MRTEDLTVLFSLEDAGIQGSQQCECVCVPVFVMERIWLLTDVLIVM